MNRSNGPPNEFEAGKPGTNARTSAEAAIESLRAKGGIFVEAVRATRMPMALTDPNLPGNPIVFANQAFLGLSGYRMEEVLGQQPHFMNGRLTDPNDAARFAEAIRSDQDDIIETVQYRKDGSRFVATVLISAFKDDDGNVLNHFMSWLDVTRRVEAEDEVTNLQSIQAALRISEERHTFLLALGDAIRASSTADAKIETAARLLGEKLNASRVLWAEYDWDRNVALIFNGWFADGAQPFPTVMQLADYDGKVLGQLKAGQTVRVDNVGLLTEEPAYAAIANVGVQALLSTPLLVNGTLKVNLSVHQHDPRHWKDDEVALVEEVSERLWAEVVRARAEEGLRESRERLGLAIEVGEFASWDWDLKTGKVEWNDRHYVVQGYDVGEVTPSFEAWIARVHPEDREQAVAEIEKARDSRQPYAHEFRTLHPDGTVRWSAARGRFFYNADGSPYRMIGVMEDMTEEKHAVDALRDREEQLRLIVESALDYAIFTLKADSTIKSWLAGAEHVFGWTKEEAEGQSVAMTFTPEDRAAGEHIKELETARETGSAPNVRWHVRKDGSRVFIDGHVVALRDETGKIDGFLKIGQDTTEKHRASEMQATLLAELQHRVRNTLGIVRSIARRTAANSSSVEEMANHLQGRLAAFSRVQSIVTRAPGTLVSFRTVVEDELVAHAEHESGRIRISGPEVNFGPKAAESLSLAIHELATNSVKYGALGDDGRLRIKWTLKNGIFAFCWRELLSEAELGPPSREGFGTELLLRGLPFDLHAETTITFHPDGIEFQLTMPMPEERNPNVMGALRDPAE